MLNRNAQNATGLAGLRYHITNVSTSTRIAPAGAPVNIVCAMPWMFGKNTLPRATIAASGSTSARAPLVNGGHFWNHRSPILRGVFKRL
jgi:hypothetical protein